MFFGLSGALWWSPPFSARRVVSVGLFPGPGSDKKVSICLLPSEQGRVSLDPGVGIALPFEARSARVVGISLDPVVLKQAKKKGKNIPNVIVNSKTTRSCNYGGDVIPTITVSAASSLSLRL